MLSIIVKNIKDILHLLKDAIYRILPDAFYYQFRSLEIHGKFVDFEKPRTFSEKIFYRMRYPRSIYSELADRVKMRSYVAERVGEEYLVPLLAAVSNVDRSVIDELPASFVMKANNSAGQVKVVEDKGNVNIEELISLSKDWMKKGFSRITREKHYSDIQPQIVFEKALLLEDGTVPDDYKVNVFNSDSGTYIFIQHMSGRFGDICQDLYDENWERLDFKRSGSVSVSESQRPKCLAEMIKVAKDLARDFGYLRVDFYLYKNKLYVGELTLTPAGGGYKFEPRCMDSKLGDKFGWPEL